MRRFTRVSGNGRADALRRRNLEKPRLPSVAEVVDCRKAVMYR